MVVSPRPAEDMCERAMINGSNDNISVAVIRIGGGDFGDNDGPDDDGRFDWAS